MSDKIFNKLLTFIVMKNCRFIQGSLQQLLSCKYLCPYIISLNRTSVCFQHEFVKMGVDIPGHQFMSLFSKDMHSLYVCLKFSKSLCLCFSFLQCMSFFSLTFCKNHHANTIQEDGHQLPERIRNILFDRKKKKAFNGTLLSMAGERKKT